LPWVVSADEIGGDNEKDVGGVPLDRNGGLDLNFRTTLCWANILAGGAGIEVFSAVADQYLDDFRELHTAWGIFHAQSRFSSDITSRSGP